MIRAVLVGFAVSLALIMGVTLVARRDPPPTLIAFLSNRDGTPAVYRMAADGRFVQPHFADQDPICTLVGGPARFVALTVPAQFSTFPYCNALFYETHLLVGDQFQSLRHIGTSERGSLDPQGLAYIQDTWLADAATNEVLIRQANLRVLMHCPSPTDDRVAFVGREVGRYDLFLYADGLIYPITDFRSSAMRLVCPAWSPDGRYVILLVDNSDLWLIDTTTRATRRLRDDVRDVRVSVAWSADGQWVALVGRIGRTALYIIRIADGGAWEIDVRVPSLHGLMWADDVLIYDAADQLYAVTPPNGPIETLTDRAANIFPAPLTMPSRPLRTTRLLLVVVVTGVTGLGISARRRDCQIA